MLGRTWTFWAPATPVRLEIPALFTREAICLQARAMEETTTASSLLMVPCFSSYKGGRPLSEWSNVKLRYPDGSCVLTLNSQVVRVNSSYPFLGLVGADAILFTAFHGTIMGMSVDHSYSGHPTLRLLID